MAISGGDCIENYEKWKKIIHKPSAATGALPPLAPLSINQLQKRKKKNVPENEINRVSVISDDEMKWEKKIVAECEWIRKWSDSCSGRTDGVSTEWIEYSSMLWVSTKRSQWSNLHRFDCTSLLKSPSPSSPFLWEFLLNLNFLSFLLFMQKLHIYSISRRFRQTPNVWLKCHGLWGIVDWGVEEEPCKMQCQKKPSTFSGSEMRDGSCVYTLHVRTTMPFSEQPIVRFKFISCFCIFFVFSVPVAL